MGAIKQAFDSIGAGIKHAFEGAGEVLKGVFTLDLKGAAQGAMKMAGGALEVGNGAMNLQPTAMCANTLMEAALGKLGKKL